MDTFEQFLATVPPSWLPDHRKQFAILFRHDPMGINFEDNTDEYDPEVGTILPRLRDCRSPEQVRRVTHEEFLRWFGGGVGDEQKYGAIAQEIWDAWRKSPLFPT